MSANLVMSDDLSRANAMDRPIVGPSSVLSDQSLHRSSARPFRKIEEQRCLTPSIQIRTRSRSRIRPA